MELRASVYLQRLIFKEANKAKYLHQFSFINLVQDFRCRDLIQGIKLRKGGTMKCRQYDIYPIQGLQLKLKTVALWSLFSTHVLCALSALLWLTY